MRVRGGMQPKIEITGELTDSGFEQAQRVYGVDGLAPSCNARDGKEPKKIEVNTIIQKVRTRKYEVDTASLVQMLRDARSSKKMTIKEISDKLDVPRTEVEHWFRKDKCSAIPSPDVWFGLKELLGIEDNSFDAPICEFVETDGAFEQSQRCYGTGGLSPTVTVGSDIKVEVRSE